MIYYIAEFQHELATNEGEEIVASSLSEAVAKFCCNNPVVRRTSEFVWVRMPEVDEVVKFDLPELEEEGDDDE